jgi:hypothetical protein
MEWIPHSGRYFQAHVGSCGYVPSYQAPKASTSCGLEWVMLICWVKPPGTLDRGPGSLHWVDDRGGRGRQVVKSRLPTLSHRVEK